MPAAWTGWNLCNWDLGLDGGTSDQSHIGSGALPGPWSFGSWTTSSTGTWLWSASERTPGRALPFDQP